MEKSIRIGILFSLTGTMKISEKGQYHAALLAIEQINQNGGINGKKIRPFVADSASNPYIAAKEAEKLIVEHKVVAILGLYTSASRKLVIPILEKYNSVLFYPTQYEGEEQHPNIVYCGPLPSQNLIHFIPWIINNIGKRFYLIGSDYIYPLEMNSQIKLLVTINKGKILGENYAPLGEQKFEEMLQGIKKLNPDIVFSTLVGNSAVSFYKQYYEAGLTNPIASLITSETEIAAINPEYTIGHYACFPYFDSINTKENRLFLNAFKSLYNTNVVSSAMENAYNGIFLLAEALKKCETIDTSSILMNIKGIKFQAPQGEIMIDNTNQHVWLNSRIGQVNEKGKFNILWESNNKIQPIPFAKYYFSNRENSDKTLNQLEEELQPKLKQYQALINELKKATQDLIGPLVFFDKDGQLLSVLHGQEILSEKLPFLLTGISVWRTPALRNSCIAQTFTNKIPAFTTEEELFDKELDNWTSVAIPIKNKNENLIGVLGIFLNHKSYFPIPLLIGLLSKITSYCVELLEKSNSFIFTYELLNNFSTFINEALFIMHHTSIVFESNSAKQLRINDYDFIIDYIKHTISRKPINKERKILHQKSSNELFEINIIKKDIYHYVSVKTLGNKCILKLDNTREPSFKDLIGTSKGFLKSLYLAKTASKYDDNVLLLGESGTGKETFARIIHNTSKRKDQPFIVLNCESTPPNLINIELFGYEDGKFPYGDRQSRPGKFELAEGGTIFLDEITEIPIELQATLIKVLQEKKVIRVGGNTSIPINVRIIAATNKNITQEMAYKGAFRSDLYSFLSTYIIELLPLRKRKEDIPQLVDFFINKNSDPGKTKKEIENETLHYLMEYNWPGNLREFKKIIERILYLSEASPKISVKHLPKYIFENSREFEETIINSSILSKNSKSTDSEKLQKKQNDELKIIEAIIKFKGNITKAAKYLQISRTTLYRKLEELNSKRQP